MTTLFISDLHLSAQRPDILELFLQFMSETASTANTLYVLGDFFDLWIGDDYIAPELNSAIKALKDYSGKGNKLFFVRGNRDFLVREEFRKRSGCEFLTDPCVMVIDGLRTLISHGDMLCTDDVEYMKFRHMVRNPDWQTEFLNKSIQDRLEYASEARRQSKQKTSTKPLEIMDANQSAVEKLMAEYEVNLMIHGHTHRPAVHNFTVNNQSMTRIVLGDWYEQGSVLVRDQGKFDLKTIENPFTAIQSNAASLAKD